MRAQGDGDKQLLERLYLLNYRNNFEILKRRKNKYTVCICKSSYNVSSMPFVISFVEWFYNNSF